jgi:DNA polymerase-4
MLVVPATEVLDFLHPLPVTVLWGVGVRTAEAVHRLGVRTVADLADTPLDTLQRAVGAAVATHLHNLAHGIDERAVESHDVEKSISAERTSDTDLLDEAEVHREIVRLSAEVGRRVRDRGLAARTIGIKIRFADVSTITRVRTLPAWTDSTEAIRETADELYRGVGLDRPRIRLVGVKAENFRAAAAAPEQLTLDSPSGSARGRTDKADSVIEVVDAARERFGANALRYGSD